MAIIHEDSLRYPEIFRTDRNIVMSGGGVHSWNSSYQWSFTKPIYLNWFAERLKGTAKYNQVPITESPVTIPVDNVAYVTIDTTTDGQALSLTVVDGNNLPQGDNIFVLAYHRNISYSPDNPLFLRNGVTIPVGGSWDSKGVTGVTGSYANDYNAQVWTVNHNLGTTDCTVILQDSSTPRQIIWPEKIEYTSINTVTVTFGEVVNGRAIVYTGGQTIMGPGASYTDFLSLTDTPNTFAGHAGESVRVNIGMTALEYYTPVSTTNFLSLTDTPSSYGSQKGKVVKVNDAETDLIFAPLGQVVQTQWTQMGSVVTGTTNIPLDDTVPQNTEGFEVTGLNVTITPTSATSKLWIEAQVTYTVSAATINVMALFQDSDVNALTATAQHGIAAEEADMTIGWWMTAGTTSATTFKIRCGINGSNTMNINGDNTSTRIFGGVCNTWIKVTEYSA